ncbi:MAG: tryptophan synthase subunit alpha [Betaproteobacteria bacterium RIFCSPLOWO2_02_FULL_67_26]|nr:MAG: tryptophan synthase subunit alpha [Betaproteobacteria bacterium RIFCSPLOWO2_02_FULL_67_26]
MSRIAATFDALKKQGKKALIPFITAGDPDPQLTVPLMHALARAGCDVIELGVPFSDPMADGPVIQRSSERALKHGVSLRIVLGYVAEFRKTDRTTPVVVFGYANPIEAMGAERFADAARAADADGVLVVDDPPEEARPLVAMLDERGLDMIFLLSPTTTDERLAQVAKLGRGYLYYVSLRGVTGAANIDISDVAARVKHVRGFVRLPVGVGFGIRDAQSACAVGAVADAVVIGSALIQEIEKAPRDQVLARVARFLAPIREGLDSLSAVKA